MPDPHERIVVIGATSGIATECLRLWVREGVAELVLVGRDESKTENVAVDLRKLNPQTRILCHTAEFLSPGSVETLTDAVFAAGPVDIALIAHGFLPDPTQGPHDLVTICETLTVSGVSPCLFAEAFARHMEKADHGTLALIGSVAGDRIRKSNYPYGSAKKLNESYMEGLRQRLARTHVKTVLIKPGPTDTPLASHHKRNGVKLASPEHVARTIVTGISHGRQVIYTPGYWRYVMALVRLIPSRIFARMNRF